MSDTGRLEIQIQIYAHRHRPDAPCVCVFALAPHQAHQLTTELRNSQLYSKSMYSCMHYYAAHLREPSERADPSPGAKKRKLG